MPYRRFDEDDVSSGTRLAKTNSFVKTTCSFPSFLRVLGNIGLFVMRVLVVDDEDSICSCIADCLRQEGFDVAEADDGIRALTIAQEEGTSISAVVTDVNMPGMDGIEMWKRMKPLVPHNCKIVFISGLDQNYLSNGFKFPGDLLQKPFSISVLIDKLTQLRDELWAPPTIPFQEWNLVL